MRNDTDRYHPEMKPGPSRDSDYEGFPFFRVVLFCVVLVMSMFVGVSFFLPRSYSAEGEVHIDAPAVMIYSLLNNLRHWQYWSPLYQRYPDLEASYPYSRSFGTGAIMRWQSGGETNGEIELLQSYPFRRVEAMLVTGGYEGMPAHVRFELENVSGGTRVTYTFSGDVHDDPINRWFALLFEAAAKAEYDKAMEALKIVAESQSGGERTLPARE